MYGDEISRSLHCPLDSSGYLTFLVKSVLDGVLPEEYTENKWIKYWVFSIKQERHENFRERSG